MPLFEPKRTSAGQIYFYSECFHVQTVLQHTGILVYARVVVQPLSTALFSHLSEAHSSSHILAVLICS